VGLRTNGTWCEEVSIVNSQVKQFFDSRFDAKLGIRLNLDGVSF